MSSECLNKIEVLDEELEERSIEYLKSMLAVVADCQDCGACHGDIMILKNLIAQKENK
jgi:hypothetical protein